MNHTFGPQQQRSFPPAEGQSEEEIIFIQNWRLGHLLVKCVPPFLTGRSPCHQPFFYRHCSPCQPVISCSSASSQGAVSTPGRSHPTPFLPDCLLGFVKFTGFLFVCLEVFPTERGCFYCNALIRFASQISSTSHLRVSAEELHKDRSLLSVKSVNGYST